MAATPYEQVMEDMLRGQDFAAQLQGLLRDSPKAGHIVDQILQAFSRAIEAAKVMAAEEGSELQSEVTCAGVGGGGKRKAAAGGGGERRGASRRRTQNSSVKTLTTAELEDGHAWRKYGQKEIQNSKHPKAYFRCTHKYDQQCAAQRQVQRRDDAPDTYTVTYIGVHTCRDPATVAPLVVRHDAALPAGSRIISFAPNAISTPTTSTTTNNTANANHQYQAAAADPQEGTLKLEGGAADQEQEEVLSSLTPAGSGRNPVATPGPDQGDVTSGLHFFDDMCFPMDDGTFDLEDILRF
ncbi:hypothetical protein PR202_gb00855 [Eleusine coracana subsp. coracana]|uniref:WRKY domain-containing protein n=1 Tax=Eleusine coracana subsp. coracana TaxID=191504 RepID=A0AAV5DV62_ELECO|nr:hypothetical protein PR202_gb00855 [Eleusine coracana subsp. coracana]